MDFFKKVSVCLMFVLVIMYKGKAGLLDQCNDNTACTAVGTGDPNAICSTTEAEGGDTNGNCICTGLFKNNENNDGCVAKDSCANDAACRVAEGDPNAICSQTEAEGGDANGNCICTGLFKNNENNDGCVAKAVSEVNCNPTDKDESTGGAAVCTSVDTNAECPIGTTKCVCKPGYKQDKTNVNTCVKVITGTCATNADCTGTVENSECTSKTCSCVAGYKDVNNLCAKVLGGRCDSANYCTGTVSNSECSEHKCQCEADYIEESHICKKALGKTCSDVNDCVTNAECEKTCKCSPGFINTAGLCAPESSATSAWMTTSLIGTSLLTLVLRLIY